MESNRQIAARNHQKTYSTGRSCKRGHPDLRYTSTGQCVECCKNSSTEFRGLSKAKVSFENNLRANDMVQATIWVKRKQTVTTDHINHILAEDGHRAQMLSSYIAMLGNSTLTHADMERHGVLQPGGKGLNADVVPYRHSDAGMLEVQIVGEWYLADDVRDLLDGKRTTVDRLPYNHGEGQQ